MMCLVLLWLSSHMCPCCSRVRWRGRSLYTAPTGTTTLSLLPIHRCTAVASNDRAEAGNDERQAAVGLSVDSTHPGFCQRRLSPFPLGPHPSCTRCHP
ncbi:hypothetical protein FA15DRAFT_435151 [Coprinopsis marcescibilis]|uniref:Secreted protein n=1 Tax=Coprinopsis marcescibilis TaxID=230819 RepID=A0A5C3K8Y6_COPMA|nr:hypothetical protein FA15DRAFT_435151 [Coprinopsis marcescibilis]